MGKGTNSYHGRLELTWTNKDQRLLAHEDGSYEWVSPADYWTPDTVTLTVIRAARGNLVVSTPPIPIASVDTLLPRRLAR